VSRASLDGPAGTMTVLPEHLACYVYGIVPATSSGLPEGVTGVDGAEIELVQRGDLAAAVGVIHVERPPGRRADLIAHHEVLDALAARGPVVPVQFGSVMRDRAEVVEDLLAPNEEHFAGLLEELTGRHQFNLRGSYLEEAVLAEVVAEDPEIAALRQRTRELPEDASYGERVRLGELVARAMEGKRAVDAQTVLDAVLPLCAAHRERPASGIDHVLDVALLVDDDQRNRFEETLEAVAEGVHERVRLRLVGPLAPYDFVEG
jgi:Gas vesicle synthesis protein GvpL/GvpF